MKSQNLIDHKFELVHPIVASVYFLLIALFIWFFMDKTPFWIIAGFFSCIASAFFLTKIWFIIMKF